MKYTLEVYYDKELTQFNKDFNLDIIHSKMNFIHPTFLNHEGWKLKSNNSINVISLGHEMFSYGEFIINTLEGYKRKEFFYDLTRLKDMSIPDFFDFKIFGNIIISENYDFLVQYLDMTLGIFEQKMLTDLNIMMCMEFYEFMNNFQQFVINYIKYPLYYNKELDHHLTKEHLEELRSFGYFNMKYGEMDYYGVWRKIDS
jgi:hypothetical protein